MPALLHSFEVGIITEGDVHFVGVCIFWDYSKTDPNGIWLASVRYADTLYQCNPKAFEDVFSLLRKMGYTSIVTDVNHPLLDMEQWERIENDGYLIFKRSIPESESN